MAIDVSADAVEVDYHEFCGALAARDLKALWSLQTQLMPNVPVPTTRPWLWKWDTVYPLAKRAGEIITIERGGDRRVLALANPGLNGLPYTSTTLWGALQYLGPHEKAPAHRHTPSAIRFVMTGEGVYTTVDGDACDMEPGDLVLTPKLNWHDHTNHGDSPMVWFDGLDLPLVAMLESIFFENYDGEVQPVLGHNLSEQRFGPGGAGVEAGEIDPSHSPLLRYAWERTDEELTALLKGSDEAAAVYAYRNPVTGGPTLATLDCAMTRVRAGRRTQTSRRTGSAVYVVLHGRGQSVISGELFEWGPGDAFVVPSWCAFDHEAAEEADLFSISDAPVLNALHLYREQVDTDLQTVDRVFSPR
jgi:gentisate 1,2-dioxygenase